MKLKNIILIFIVGVAMMASACSVEEPIDENGKKPVITGDLVQIPLSTNSDEYTEPITKTGKADENVVGATPWVLVFRGDNDNGTFFEAKQATVNGGKSYVELTQTPSGSRILVIANPPATFFNGTANVAFNQTNIEAVLIKGTTTFKSAVDNLLRTAQLVTPLQTTVPYTPNLTIPMTGMMGLPGGITSATTIGTTGSPMLLNRIVAKVTVTNSDTDFKLLGAGITNAMRDGRLYQGSSALRLNTGLTTDYLTASTGDGVTGISAASTGVAQTTAANPIYVYESAGTETNLSSRISVIIKGTFNGTDYYYRLAFVKADYSEISVTRNKHYSFVITKISGPGYGSVAEAKAAPASNIIYKIKVTDLNSFDMMDNGAYYLGVSNSEYVVYGQKGVALTGLLATILATDATTAITKRDITLTSVVPAGSMTLTTAGQKIGVASSPGNITQTDVKVNLASNFTSGTIKLELGNMTKEIKLTRKPWFGASGFNEEFSGNFVSGTVSSQGDGGASWMTLSDNQYAEGTSIVRRTPGSIFLNGTPDYAFTGTVARSGGEVFLERDNQQGRVKIAVAQNSVNQGVPPVAPAGMIPYIGTFHRWSEVGERVIRIKRVAGMEGAWTAKVVAGDFIKMDKDVRKPFPYADNDPAEDHEVNGNATVITGNLASTDDYLEFRVGMTGTLATATTAPRYGLILLSYADHNYSSFLYVRQGEEADYLMRKDETGTSGSTMANRPNANKFCVYNVSAPGKKVSLTWAGCEDVGEGQGVFTDFPTQHGYLFQFAHKNKAIHPSYPVGAITGWMVDSPGTHQWATSYDSCPTGYRRPSVGPAYSASISAVNSEYVSSLVINPPEMENIPNMSTGYYADGFFDRRTITKPSGINSATDKYCVVADGTAEAAYIGTLYYNPSTNAAIFFPHGGIRYTTTGDLRGAGGASCYWSSTTTSYTLPQAWGFYPGAYFLPDVTRSWAMPVRCVTKP